MPRSLLLLLAAMTSSAVLTAAPLYVSASGRFSSTDIAGPLVSPNGIFALTFAIDSNPIPLSGTVTTLGFDVPVLDFHYTLNGAATSASPAEIRFNTLTNGGLFDITFGAGLSASEFSFTGAQAFSGSTAVPVIAIGQYALSSWTFSNSSNFDVQNPVGASVSVTPAPEPSSLATIIGGIAAVIALVHRKRKITL